MSANKSTFYIDESHREYVKNVQTLNHLNSPSAALRKILDESASQPPVNDSEDAELRLLGEILKDNTRRARIAIAEAFEEIEKTKAQLRSQK